MNGKIDGRIIPLERSVLVSCDVIFEELERIISQIYDLPGIGGCKFPLQSGDPGWKPWNDVLRKYSNRLVSIYDSQKLGKDIPDKDKLSPLMRSIKRSGFDAVIIFPEPETQRVYTEEAIKAGLKVMIHGKMTYKKMVGPKEDKDAYDKAIGIYKRAIDMGINNLCVPASGDDDLEFVANMRGDLKLEDRTDIIYYPIGISLEGRGQGGTIEGVKEVLGEKTSFHIIAGRAVYDAPDMKIASQNLINKLS